MTFMPAPSVRAVASLCQHGIMLAAGVSQMVDYVLQLPTET
jgi:hypothetical protein